MADSDTFRIVGEILDDFLAELRAGQKPDIESYVARQPAIASQIRQALSAVLMVEGPDEGNRDPSEPVFGVEGPQGVPSQIGEFRIIRELGRGGMGAVYEAVQNSLDRRVALKVLSWNYTDKSEQATRFVNEAQAAARLHHTNIVPVFQVGRSDNVFYYAMQLIEGAGLDRVIQELRSNGQYDSQSIAIAEADRKPGNAPTAAAQGGVATTTIFQADAETPTGPDVAVTESRPPASSGTSGSSSPSSNLACRQQKFFVEIGRIVRQAAEGLEYAHANRIVHRDIKPANLLLDRNGTTWITDFGLAKIRDTDLTRTGQIVGTLRYMAPERLQGADDKSGDIYSLGLTLYELATLQPAFDETDHGALVGKIMKDVVPDPRTISDKIPVDLAMIIQKATAREPSLRYQSAAEFASDLGRFEEGRPIAARQTSTWTRIRFWSKRNPLTAALLSTVGLLIIVLGIGSAIVAYNFSLKNTEIGDRLKSETRLRKQADERLLETSLANIRALKNSTEPGRGQQRETSIKTVAELITTIPDTDISQLDLRNMAIDNLVLFDVTDDVFVSVQEEYLTSENKWDFSSDLSWVARFDEQGNLALRSLSDSTDLETIPRQWDYGRTLVSPDDRFVAVYGIRKSDSQCAVEVWDRLTKEVVVEDAGSVYGGIRNRCSFSRDAERFAYIDQKNEVCVVDLKDGRPIWKSGPLAIEAEWLALAPDGQTILYDQSNFVFWFSFEKQQVLQKFEVQTHTHVGCWSSRPGWFAVATDTSVISLWDVRQPSAPITKYEGHREYIDHLVFHPDGEMLMSTSYDKTTRFWSKGSLQLVQRFGGARFSSNGEQVAYADPRNEIGRWKVAGTARRDMAASISNESTPAFRLAVAPDRNLIAWGGWYPFVSVCDLDTGTVARLETNEVGMQATLFRGTTDQPEVLVGTRNGIHSSQLLFDPRDARIRFSELREVRSFEALGQKLFPLGPQHLIRTESANGFTVCNREFVPKHVATESWTGASDVCKKNGIVAVSSKAVSDVFLYWLKDLQEQATPAPFHTISLNDDFKRCAPMFSPDGNYLAISGHGGFHIYSMPPTTKGAVEPQRFVPVNDQAFSRVAWSSDGGLIAVTSFDSVRIVQTDTWESVAQLSAPPRARLTGGTMDSSADVRFLQDDELLVCGTQSNSIVVWNMKRLRQHLDGLNLNWQIGAK